MDKTETENQTREIFVIDDLQPEDNAMVQALYSRDPRSITEHLKKVAEVGSGKFMGQFYVNYSHKSIGDCGSTTMALEGISMLAAKAVQNWPLYNGQEASTRYLDFKGRAIVDPIKSKTSKEIHNRWMALYNRAQEVLIPYLTETYPIQEGEKESDYQKAIKVKAFDIARGFLPAGMTTLVAWHSNLRQAADHLKNMRHHPLEEVRAAAEETLKALQEKYPNSFSHKQYPEEEAYLELGRQTIEYSDENINKPEYTSHLKPKMISKYRALLECRPAKAELPQELRKCGDIDFRFLLDFGSYRDLQRQRSMIHIMPLLTLRHGFHPWYLESLPENFRKEVKTEIEEIAKLITSLKCDDATRQYYIAMGYQVACDITCSLPSAVYIAELRASQTVHSTLRPKAQWMAEVLAKLVPGIALHYDNSPDIWSTRRGKQDIVAKQSAA